MGREDKSHVIVRVNRVRTRCPSDANFTGVFDFKDGIFSGEIKVLFSKGTFFVSGKAANIKDLMTDLLGGIEDQITAWKDVRFDQPNTFIDYSEWIERTNATGS